MTPFYRVRQFWNTLRSAPTAEELQQAEEILSLPLMDLFERMQPVEKSHCLKVYQKLSQAGEKSTDLLTAALLHDVGKSLYPLSPWERVLVVITKALSPSWAENWGRFEPIGWRRSFAVAARHPEWGAHMAQAAGASNAAVSLIRRHREEKLSGTNPEDELLSLLQRADDES